VFAVVGHNLALLGVLALAPLALLLHRGEPARPLRVALFAAVLVSFAVPNVAHYERSWDIVKFFAVGAFFANVLLADAIGTLWVPRRGIALALLVLALPSGLLWVWRHGPLNGTLAARYTEAAPSRTGVALDAFLLSIDRGDLRGARTLTTDPSIHQLGYRVVGADWRRAEAGLALDRPHADRVRAQATAALRDLHIDSLRALDVSLLLLSQAHIAALDPEVTAALGRTPLHRLGQLSMPAPMQVFEVGQR
jgi:hypothetical protein